MPLKTKKIGGIKFSFNNQREFDLIYRDIFIKKANEFKADNASPFILDCGAHIGISILYFKKLYPKAKIIAFEPNPDTFKLLDLNVKQNNLKNVKIINVALSNKKRRIKFYIARRDKAVWNWGDSAVKNKWYNAKKFKTIKVSAVRLSSYINKRVDLIKIDIEGTEERVLKEIEGKLCMVREIIIEFHGSSTNKSNNIENILSILDKNFFKYTLKQDYKKIKYKKIKRTDPFWLTVHAKRR